MNKIVFFVLLFLLFVGHSFKIHAAFGMKQVAVGFGDSTAKPRPQRRWERLKMEHDRLKEARAEIKRLKRIGPNHNNRNGILSVSFIGILLLAFAAVVIITPTIPDVLAALLFGFSIITLSLSIVFGAIGRKKDHNNALATLGMVVGICLLSMEVLLGLGFLLLIGSLGG